MNDEIKQFYADLAKQGFNIVGPDAPKQEPAVTPSSVAPAEAVGIAQKVIDARWNDYECVQAEEIFAELLRAGWTLTPPQSDCSHSHVQRKPGDVWRCMLCKQPLPSA